MKARLILTVHHPLTRVSLALLGVGVLLFAPSACDPDDWKQGDRW